MHLFMIFMAVAIMYEAVNSMASLGNGSMKGSHTTIRNKVERFCRINPGLCRLKNSLMKRKKNNKPNTKKAIESAEITDNEVDEDFDKFGNTVDHQKLVSSCHFTEKASNRILHTADDLAKNVKTISKNKIVGHLKRLIQDLVLMPKAIVICKRKQETERKVGQASPFETALQKIVNRELSKFHLNTDGVFQKTTNHDELFKLNNEKENIEDEQSSKRSTTMDLKNALLEKIGSNYHNIEKKESTNAVDGYHERIINDVLNSPQPLNADTRKDVKEVNSLPVSRIPKSDSNNDPNMVNFNGAYSDNGESKEQRIINLLKDLMKRQTKKMDSS